MFELGDGGTLVNPKLVTLVSPVTQVTGKIGFYVWFGSHQHFESYPDVETASRARLALRAAVAENNRS
jgi:hypothetical protein